MKRILCILLLLALCVSMAACESAQEARLAASAYSARGAGGCVAQLEGAWRVLAWVVAVMLPPM